MFEKYPENVWYGNTRVTSYELQAESFKARVKIQKYEFRSTSYEFKFTSYQLKSTSYEFQFTSYQFKSTISRIIKSTITQVNILQFFTRN